MKTFWKTVYRMLFSHKGRFFANFFIALLSLSLTSGLGSLPSSYQSGFEKNYETCPDLIVKSKKETGFSHDEIDSLAKEEGISSMDSFLSMDYQDQDSIYRIYLYDFDTLSQAKPVLEEGELPNTFDSHKIEVLAETGNLNRNYYHPGDEVVLHDVSFSGLSLGDITLSITGIANSPLYNSVQKENAYLKDEEDKYIQGIFYLDKKTIPNEIEINISGAKLKVPLSLPTTDIYLTYAKEREFFSDTYKKEMEEKKQDLLNRYSDISVLTLEENVSYALFKSYNDKVRKISYVFPIFFIAVCALVNLITSTRLIQEERPIIACYVSLGEPKGRIAFKYLLFSFLSVGFGCIFGILLGTPLLPKVVLPAYQAVFEMPTDIGIHFSLLGLFSALAILLVSLGVTLSSILSNLKERPAQLMKSKSPKPGKKIWMEKIPLIWNPLPFSFKSSFRNIFRHKKNLALTSLSLIGATMLVMIGFALLDNSNALKHDDLYANVASSMGSISFVIIFFAIAMAVVVVYSLTNMNIQDRTREIATLKVLGYHDHECSMYTFREIMIISLLASLLALPLSALVIAYVFRYLDFGSISNVKWYSYLMSYVLVNLTAIAVNYLLYPLIKRIDMNDSLKRVDE